MNERRFATAVLLLGTVLLSACAQRDVELQKPGEGIDAMSPSPCACEQLDYKGVGYRWVG